MIESKGHKITPIDGDLAVSRNAEIGGDADIHGKARVAGSLKVEGFLDAPHIKGAAKGLFNSVEELTREYPNPRPGWFAIVLDATNKEKGILYKAENRGWVATTDEAKLYEFIKDSINVFASKGELADETQRAQGAENILTQRIVNETVRATEAENEIKKNAVKFNRIGITGYTDKLELRAATIDGDEVHYIDIPAATETKAGVVSAEDKKKFVKSITWNNDTNPSNMNDFVTAGVYDIKGERIKTNDNLPILNANPGHSFNARLTVLDSSISGSGEDDDKCITQVLSFSNRLGQGEVYIRTGKGGSLDNLTWEKWSTLQRNVNVDTVTSLDHLIDNGIYSGVYIGTGNKFTFVMVVINDYALAAKLGADRVVNQFLYAVEVGGVVRYTTRQKIGGAPWGGEKILNEKEITSMIKDEIKKVNDRINTLIDDNNPDTLDSIKDFVNWVNEHGNTVEGLLAAINANTAAITAERTRAIGQEGLLNNAIAEEKSRAERAEQAINDKLDEEIERSVSADQNLLRSINEEARRATEAEMEINQNTIAADSLGCSTTTDDISLEFETLDGQSTGSVTIPSATAEKAGVMTAADKKTISNSNIAIYTNAINSQAGGNIFDKNAIGILVGKIYMDNFGTIKDNDSYNITDYMAVIPGETYSCPQIIRKPSGYDLDKKFKKAIDYSSGVFTIPDGVYWIRLSYNKGWAPTFCVNKGVTALPWDERTFGLVRTDKLYDAAVTTEKLSDNAVTMDKLSEELKERVQSLPTVVRKNGAFVKKGDLPSGSVWEFPQNSVEVGEYMTFSANIVGDFNALYIGHDKTGGAYMKITANEVVLCSHVVSPLSEKTFEHGLTIENNIQVYIEKKLNAVVSIKVVSNGVSSAVFSDGYWYGNKGTPFVENDGCELADCSFGWTCKAINSDIWAFGDSYFGVNGTIRWMAYLVSAGHTNLVVNGFGGQGSITAYTDLTNLLTIGTPKKILWCLGMNDADSSTAVNANWLNTYNSLKALCENNNIELILATIPTVPTRIHKFKNEIIRSSGYRYIDFDKAVGANEATGAWFGDMLSTDNVHPSETGALALYNRAITDMPELLNC